MPDRESLVHGLASKIRAFSGDSREWLYEIQGGGFRQDWLLQPDSVVGRATWLFMQYRFCPANCEIYCVFTPCCSTDHRAVRFSNETLVSAEFRSALLELQFGMAGWLTVGLYRVRRDSAMLMLERTIFVLPSQYQTGQDSVIGELREAALRYIENQKSLEILIERFATTK